MDGLREMSEAIASECDVTFELYRSSRRLLLDTTMSAVCLHVIVNNLMKIFILKRPWPLIDIRPFSHMYRTNKH